MYDKILSNIQSFNINYHVVPGNHDIYDNYSQILFEKKINDLNSYKVFKNYNYLIFCINSNPFLEENANWNKLDEYKYVEKILNKFKDYNIIFTSHHPLWFDSRWKSQFLPIFNSKLKWYFSGHLHGYSWHEENGTKYIISGGGGSDMQKNKQPWNGGFYFFNLLSISDDSLSELELIPYINTDPFNSDYEYNKTLLIQRNLNKQYKNETIILKRNLIWDLVIFSMPILGLVLLNTFNLTIKNDFIWSFIGGIIGLIMTFIPHFIPYRYLVLFSIIITFTIGAFYFNKIK